MKNIDIIRQLAKSIKYQNLFRISKDKIGINIFKNNNELSAIQEIFLSYVYSYSNIFDEIALKEISELVLKDDIYTDAYLYWKQNKKDDQKKADKIPTGHDVNLVFSNKPLKKVK
jgi:hypothetical protein